MNVRRAKYFLWFFFSLLLLYFLIKVITTYFKISPFINNLFETGNRIENNQQMIDSVLVLHNLFQNENTTINFEKDKKILLHFWSIKDKKYLSEIPWIEKNRSKNLFVILNDNIGETKLFVNENNFSFPVYYCDTISLPFKYRKLIYPYTIEIVGDSILSSFIGNINRLN